MCCLPVYWIVFLNLKLPKSLESNFDLICSLSNVCVFVYIDSVCVMSVCVLCDRILDCVFEFEVPKVPGI